MDKYIELQKELNDTINPERSSFKPNFSDPETGTENGEDVVYLHATHFGIVPDEMYDKILEISNKYFPLQCSYHRHWLTIFNKEIYHN